MLAFLGRSILLGLITACVVLVAVPSLRPSSPVSLPQLDDAPAPLSFNYAVKRASPAVVNIYNRRYENNESRPEPELITQGLGSGVIMSDKGYIVTNYHVVANADQVIVALQDGRILNAQLIGLDQLTDLAVLKINADHLPVIPVNPEYKAAVGDVVLAIGNPYNLGQTTTFGIISATGRSGMSFYGPQDFLQTDAAINRGNSGGALVNTHGELIGINTASFQQATNIETNGISFAIPYQQTIKIMNKLIADGRVIRGWIGIQGREINPVMARLYDAKQVNGIIVEGMDPNGPASKAGFQKNDIVVEIAGKQVNNVQSVNDIITDIRPGTNVNVKILRDGKPMIIPVKVANRPATENKPIR
ncbi:outer membrane-stress sensor serine endopeptidase DegS [Photobacterium angustum]|uniref:Serine endoprotease DegS n=1 Tax=Photobacterium angustum TaxID=661 RepID=A0A855SDG3_PHOAN|nr:outer membrane-stress sensor serine endopeptidase DegS [Photobacterium angustum]KJF81160.1 peptidase [Photobacterium damselae subsp. damselae]KJG29577.1 peptidase [Photobacterium angustum]KJG39309.1 peptidase [Photobacterium angustum]KJG44672.1 peptidase [Photobacterium angustum]KJG48345.1 peptidase [Photobacterium angustum]